MRIARSPTCSLSPVAYRLSLVNSFSIQPPVKKHHRNLSLAHSLSLANFDRKQQQREKLLVKVQCFFSSLCVLCDKRRDDILSVTGENKMCTLSDNRRGMSDNHSMRAACICTLLLVRLYIFPL